MIRMKVRASVKKISPDDKIVRRKSRVYAINKKKPKHKQVQIALTYIYGIGPKASADILVTARVEPTVRIKDLTDTELSLLQEIITNNYTVEGELQRVVTGNIKR